MSNGKFTNIADEAFQLAARNAGLSEKANGKIIWKRLRPGANRPSLKAVLCLRVGALGVNIGIASSTRQVTLTQEKVRRALE